MTPIIKNKNSIYLVIVSVILIFLSGCSIRVADLSLISTRSIDLTNASLDPSKGKRRSAEVCGFVLFDLYPIISPNLEDAVDKALVRGNGNIMVDTATEFSWAWVGLGHVTCIYVEGTVFNTSILKKSLQPNFQPDSHN